MEKAMDCEQKSLINLELVQGKELANQLKTQLDRQDSREMCELLAGKILSSYENALLLLKFSASILEENLPINSALESPHSCTSEDSPKSEISNQSHKNVIKKRKALPRWSEQIQVSSETGPETPHGDGYSWRKYGQKDILGATYPRAYYRCTHRHGQGCLATKQVQKSDNDPSTFGITYRGRHTCNQTRHVPPRKEEKKPKKQKIEQQLKQEHGIHKQTEDIVLNFGTCLEPQEFGTKVERIPSFSFPSTLVESENVENNFFLMSQQCSNQMNNFGLAQNLQTSESDLSEIWSAPNSVTNSPIGDLDFSLDQVEFDPDFPFDILEYFH